MDDGIGDLLGQEYGNIVREAMRPMLMELMMKMKRELKTELTSQLRRDMRLLMMHYKQGAVVTVGPLVPTATRVADEKGFVDHRIVCRRRKIVLVPDEERGWFDAVRKFNKAE